MTEMWVGLRIEVRAKERQGTGARKYEKEGKRRERISRRVCIIDGNVVILQRH